MDVLVVGSGGREHALARALSRSPLAGAVHVAPGNGGTDNNVAVRADDVGGLADFAESRSCFTVIGPEAPLAAGLADELAARGLEAFGPSRAAARIESSKAWSKGFMARHGIPTAEHGAFGSREEAMAAASGMGYDVAVKADGLAAGKGVEVCGTRAEVGAALDRMMGRRELGDAGSRVVVERRMRGPEASCIALCSGRDVVPLASSMDYKRARDGGAGPNTGGMGAVSPAPSLGPREERAVLDEILRPAAEGLAAEGAPFRGFLYAGVMLEGGRPRALEFNARMGDPECQAVLERADFDLLEYALACSRGGLASLPPPRWLPRSSACVVLASEGYPGPFPRGEEVSGLDEASAAASVYHAGTRREGGRVLTDGGRVLGVTALGGTAAEAAASAYAACGMISWPHKYCRTDIGSAGGAGGPRLGDQPVEPRVVRLGGDPRYDLRVVRQPDGDRPGRGQVPVVVAAAAPYAAARGGRADHRHQDEVGPPARGARGARLHYPARAQQQAPPAGGHLAEVQRAALLPREADGGAARRRVAQDAGGVHLAVGRVVPGHAPGRGEPLDAGGGAPHPL